jgi:hypothetical protein
MQDLVGIGVADAAEELRQGEGALDGVVLRGQPRREGGEVGRHHVDAARVHRRQRVAALQQVERGAPLRAGLGEQQGPGGLELEQRQRDPPRRLASGREPLEAAGDHQVDDQEELALEPEDDPLGESLDALDLSPSAVASGGTAVRTRNGFSTLIRCSRLPTTRRASRST